MRANLAVADQMTIDEFLAMTAERPDGERWELIEGVAVMNASPAESHQTIAMNIVGLLRTAKIATRATWLPMLGVGTRVPISPNSLPQPDAFVKAGPATELSVTDDALVLFEILSKSNTPSDRAWRRRVYASVPNCQHYVTIASKAVAIARFDRAAGWGRGADLTGLAETLELPALGCALPLAEIYRWTPLASGARG